MRILILTNFYPPFVRGGQEQTCREVVEGLKRRGHEITVLTSMFGVKNQPKVQNEIYRWLYLEMDFKPWRHSFDFFFNRKRQLRQNLKRLSQIVEQVNPEIIFIWGMWNLPVALAAFLETHCSDRVVYRLADYWPTLPSQHDNYWRTPGRNWLSSLLKVVLGKVALSMLKDSTDPILQFKNVFCISKAMKKELLQLGVPVSNARIIYNGINADNFMMKKQVSKSESKKQTLRLVYLGRLAQEKGVETAIKAIQSLVYKHNRKDFILSIIGDGPLSYVERLKYLVTQNKLNDYVFFKGRIDTKQVYQLLPTFDVLLFPSTWIEPFGRVILEGMASSLVVIATPLGGPAEIVIDKENGLYFEPNEPNDLAQKILSLANNQEWAIQLAQAGRRTVMEKFTANRMLDQIEGYLQEIMMYSKQKQTLDQTNCTTSKIRT